MKLSEQFDRLEKLIIDRSPDIATMRSTLHSIREQAEAYQQEVEAQAQFKKKYPKQPADDCPFCREKTGELIEIKPDPNPHFAMLGSKYGHYECSNCGNEYEKEIKI
jgi:hypothetical protein